MSQLQSSQKKGILYLLVAVVLLIIGYEIYTRYYQPSTPQQTEQAQQTGQGGVSSTTVTGTGTSTVVPTITHTPIASFFGGTSTALNDIIKASQGIVADTHNVISAVSSSLASGGSTAEHAISNGITSATKAVSQGTNQLATDVRTGIANAGTTVEQAVSVPSHIPIMFNRALATYATDFRTGIGSAPQVAASVEKSVSSAVTQAAKETSSVASAITSNAESAITTGANDIVKGAESFGSSLSNFLAKPLMW